MVAINTASIVEMIVHGSSQVHRSMLRAPYVCKMVLTICPTKGLQFQYVSINLDMTLLPCPSKILWFVNNYNQRNSL